MIIIVFTNNNIFIINNPYTNLIHSIIIIILFYLSHMKAFNSSSVNKVPLPSPRKTSKTCSRKSKAVNQSLTSEYSKPSSSSSMDSSAKSPPLK